MVYSKNKNQIGFCRVITDQATFVYLADVVVVDNERGNGYAKWMIDGIRKNPELDGLRKWLLAPIDAHALYEKSGWQLLENPGYFMEIANKNTYEKNKK